MKKICTKCGAGKELKEFNKDTTREDGRFPWCRTCKNKNDKEYKIANSEMIAKKKRVKRIETQKELNQYERDYYYANKEKRLEQGKESRLRRKDKITKTNHKYYMANKEKIAQGFVMYNNRPASYKAYVSRLEYAETVTRGTNGEVLVPCTYCGKAFAPILMAVKNRIAALEGRQRGEARLYCSDSCKNACPSYGQISHWKNQKPATSREVGAYFRQVVLKRDDWTCQKCGAGIEAELHVHHIEGAIQNPIISNDIGNGITLCKKCHKYVHSQSGCTYYELRCPQQRELPNASLFF